MKIYTKTGDKGTTSLIGGKRIPKSDIHLEIYGTLDELGSFIGLLKQTVSACEAAMLTHIQETLFRVNCLFANGNPEQDEQHPFDESATSQLEEQIDSICDQLPPMKCFEIPGDNTNHALCHICRCICRRAERHIYQMELLPNQAKAAQYINRLSDYFFALGRKHGQTK